jgi:hypothetical protein
MTYIDTITGEYPLFIGDLMLRTGLPEAEIFPSSRYAVVPEKVTPVPSRTERMFELPPVLVNGVWEKQFLVRQEMEAEKEWRLNEEARIQAMLAAYNQPVPIQNLDAAGSQPDVLG